MLSIFLLKIMNFLIGIPNIDGYVKSLL